MNAIELLSGYDSNLGKLCIFGCKKQKQANAAKVAATEADKIQAAKIAEMQTVNASIATDNAQVIAEKDAETKKKTMIIAGVGGGLALLLIIAYVVRKSSKK